MCNAKVFASKINGCHHKMKLSKVTLSNVEFMKKRTRAIKYSGIILLLMYQYWLHDEEKTSSCNHSVQKSSASTLPWFIYKPTGLRSLDNQPITAKFSKIPLYWHSSFGWNSHMLANEIAWLQIIGKGNANLSEQSWGGNMSQLKLELIPFLSFSAVQWYFFIGHLSVEMTEPRSQDF